MLVAKEREKEVHSIGIIWGGGNDAYLIGIQEWRRLQNIWLTIDDQ